MIHTYICIYTTYTYYIQAYIAWTLHIHTTCMYFIPLHARTTHTHTYTACTYQTHTCHSHPTCTHTCCFCPYYCNIKLAYFLFLYSARAMFYMTLTKIPLPHVSQPYGHLKQNLRTEFSCDAWSCFPGLHSCWQFYPTSHTVAMMFIPIMHQPRSNGAQRSWTWRRLWPPISRLSHKLFYQRLLSLCREN